MTWLAGSFLVLGVALAAGFGWYERTHPTARVLALIATLAALAALGRVAFAPIPNVKPTTDIVLLTGYALGGAPGFAVGAVAALASNLFFGQGPWTPWQMVAWGSVGLMGALLLKTAGPRLGRRRLALACAAGGVLYGCIMNLSLWVTFSGDHTLDKLVTYSVTSFPFDAAHVLGNVVFCLVFGPALVSALRRFKARFEVDWRPLAAPAASLLLVLAIAAPASAATSREYLAKTQNADGGWGPGPGSASTQLHTGWVLLGLAADGVNPADQGRALAYLRTQEKQISDLGEIDRTILVLVAAGEDPRAFAGRDLVREVVSKQRRDGSYSGRVNTTAFAILALRAAGRSASDPAVRNAARWIAKQANGDGGFNFARRGGGSGIDDTGAALQALAAAGRRATPTARRAATFLVRRQNSDGGFPLQPGGASNAQSTAWAVQGLIAAGRDPAKVRRNGSRDPLSYLRSLTASSGAVRYSRSSTQTPVWVTAQALTALARRPFPLSPVARRAQARARPSTPTATPTPAPTATAAATPRPKARTNRPKPPATPPAVDLAPLAYRAGFVLGELVG